MSDSINFTPPSGKITNVEYIYDEELKRYRIYYREDMPNCEVKLGDFEDDKVKHFYPCIYVKRKPASNAVDNRRLNEIELEDGNNKRLMDGVYWGGQKYTIPSVDGGTAHEAIVSNNKIWQGYPFLTSLRRDDVSYTIAPRITRDYSVYAPVYDKNRKTSFENFIIELKKHRNISDEAITNNIKPKYQWTSQWVYGQKQDDRVKLRYFFLDIEVLIDKGIDVEKAENPITMIQINDSITNTNHIFFIMDESKHYEKEDGVKYYECNNEKEMLVKFVDLCAELKPVALSAWFGDGFDFPYIANRMRTLAKLEPDANFKIEYYSDVPGKEQKFSERNAYCSLLKRLSPYNKVFRRSVTMFKGRINFFAPMGVYEIDYMDIYKKYSYGERESFGLGAICMYELGEGKVEYQDVATNLDDVYHNNFDLFMKYGVQDVKLLYNLEQKIKFLNIAFMQAYSMGINVDDVLGTIYPWTHKIYNECIRLGKAIPNSPIAETFVEFEGGFTFVSMGKKEDIAAYDVTSLYPKTMESYNISYETLIPYQDYDQYDDKRYLFIKYGIFNQLKEDIAKVLEREYIELKDFSFPIYKKFFGLAKIIERYFIFGGNYKGSMEVVLSKLIENMNANDMQKLKSSIKVAGVILSPMGCFFENEMGFDVDSIARLIRCANSENVPQSEREFLSFYLGEYLDNIVADNHNYNDKLSKIMQAVSKHSGKEIRSVTELLKYSPKSIELINRVRNESYRADLISKKGVIPSVIGKIFKERKAASKERDKYTEVRLLIEAEQKRRKEAHASV